MVEGVFLIGEYELVERDSEENDLVIVGYSFVKYVFDYFFQLYKYNIFLYCFVVEKNIFSIIIEKKNILSFSYFLFIFCFLLFCI